MVLKIADNRDPRSLASRLRLRRNRRFLSLVGFLPRPLTVLDVGGTETVWKAIGLADQPDVRITIINVRPVAISADNISVVVGDARDMHQFRNGQFDVVYSNSVIEHVGSLDDMRRMAREVQRVGKRCFIQTPNHYFPIEPHFVFPFFQFLPRAMQIALLRSFNLGWFERQHERKNAERIIDSIRLLSLNEIRSLFPGFDIEEERLLGLTKSFVAYKI